MVKCMRIGHGYDVHKLVPDRKLIIGGVDIPYKYGLLGHSDADVLLHAIMDAMLGAAAEGDIGLHFPDNDDRFEGISSLKLLENVNEIILHDGYVVSNIDATIVAQAPKMRPFIDEMRKNISEVLSIDISQINIKGTTEEHLGFTGSGEGISAHAVCLLDSLFDASTPIFDSEASCSTGTGCSGGGCSACPKRTKG
jgi:2-C-methyl-D-erythritol 2,4-cyclodiphosphate synthase